MLDELMDIIQKMLTTVVEGDLNNPVTINRAVTLANEFIEIIED